VPKSTTTTTTLKRKSFPHTAHRAADQWRQKHRGRTCYFGSLADPDNALARINGEWWDYVLKGLTPPLETDDADVVCTVRTLCNAFLQSQRTMSRHGPTSLLDSPGVVIR
jgi:hypothetical protein